MQGVIPVEPNRYGESLLLQEMTHRINNEFASVISFVSLAAARSESCAVKATLAGVMDILHCHAKVHHALQMPVADGLLDAAKYIRELCYSIGRSKLKYRGIAVTLIEHPLQLRAEQCWRLGLIVSELITNASRHAFGDQGGAIQIELRQQSHTAVCRVADNGSGSKIVRSGRGLKIIQQLSESLQGKIEQSFGEQGTVTVLSFPLPD